MFAGAGDVEAGACSSDSEVLAGWWSPPPLLLLPSMRCCENAVDSAPETGGGEGDDPPLELEGDEVGDGLGAEAVAADERCGFPIGCPLPLLLLLEPE